MKYSITLLLVFYFSLNCKSGTFAERETPVVVPNEDRQNNRSEDTLPKKEEKTNTPYKICFWNVKNLSKAGLYRNNKGPYILDFIQKYCDIIALTEIRSAKIDMASEFEESLNEEYNCSEGKPKGRSSRKEKYLVCIKLEQEPIHINKEEYEDIDNIFSRPPTLFSFKYRSNHFLIVPFHSTPKDKEELKAFEVLIHYTDDKYKNQIRIYGGDFNTGSNFQKESFLDTLFYFSDMIQFIREGTTFANQKHDIIFMEKKFKSSCKGNVWKLDKLFPEVEGRKQLEKISDHHPVSIDCKF